MTSKDILTIVLTLVETKAKVKPLYAYITDPRITLLDFKRKLLRMFKSKQRPQITDFKVYCQENSKDTIPIDIFERQYENENLLELLQILNITNPTTKTVKIQYSVIQREFRAYFINKKKDSQLISVPLSFRANVSFIKDQFKENDFVKDNLTPPLHDFRFYIQNQGKTYDLEKFLQSSLDFDIKALFSNPQAYAFVFLYPNTVHISYHRKTFFIECGDQNETVQSVIERSLQSFGKTDLSPDHFSLIYNGKEITQKHIHDFLLSLTQNARLRLLQKADFDFFFVYLKFGRTNIGFRFPRSLKNPTLQMLVEQYFNIKDPQMKLERRYNKEETIPITTKISDKTILPGEEFNLKTTEPITHITRQFQIGNEIKSIDIPINSRIENLHQLIQQAFHTGSSIESISISNEPLLNEQRISQLYIPPEENFIVTLRANPKTRFIIIKHDLEIESVDVELDVESQVSTIKQLCHLPETTILYFHERFQLKGNDKIKDAVKSYPKERVIDAYISNLYYFEYEETKRPLELTGRISNHQEAIKSRFQNHGLPQDKEIFITDENGISFIPNDKNIDEYPNGTTFKVKLVLKLQLNITFDQKQYSIEIENTKSGQDLIHQLSTITRHEEETLRIYSPLQKVIEPDRFLFEYFTDPNKTYKISAIPLKEFPFINESGKMFYVYLSPTDTISYVKELIKKPKKKSVIKISPDDKLYLVYNGQLLDDTKPISSILEQNSDNLEEEDTDPLDFDEPINVYVNDITLITVTWTVVTTSQSSSSNSSPTVNKVIKGTKIGTIQNIISKASSLPYDSIVLVSNGEELPSDFELHKNITLTVTIRQNESANPIDVVKTMSQTQRILEKNATTAEQKVANNDDDDDGYEYEDENNDIDEDKLLEQAHGVIARSDNDDEYVYKFKYINGEEFKHQLPKDVSVIQAIEAIVNMRNNEGNITDPADVTISMSSTRLNNFHIFAALAIPQTVNYFSVKVVSINQSLIFTRNGIKS